MTSLRLTAEKKERFNVYFRNFIFKEGASNEMLQAFESIPNVSTQSSS